MEFAYNNSYHTSLGIAPYEALYGRRCRTQVHWTEVGERKLKGLKMVHQTMDEIQMIKSRLKAAQDRQKSYVDLKKRDIEYNVGDKKQPIELREDLTYEEEPVEVIDREEKVLRNKAIPFVKIRWSNHSKK
ncbi:uncharacterized protein LOC131172888 [Hevea brasiliensis]|uniref:uncharacterized protein LOC131172888 n=1 Tax=Hevea brasiliensis TaxID=3981 RepID=UPI0025F72145|nr:uncharacterized protein LOC131172888 [Hevea brasiliensis]